MRSTKLAGIAVALAMAVTSAPVAQAATSPTSVTIPQASVIPVEGPLRPVEPRGLDRTGATVPGSSRPIPADAIWMATNGSDANPGTKQKPVATIRRAMEVVREAGTIAIRGGTYRQSLAAPGEPYAIMDKSVTFINAPREQVWFDGSDIVPRHVWSRGTDGLWRDAWQTPSFCDGKYETMANNTSAMSNVCTHWDMTNSSKYHYPGDPQQLWKNATKLRQVALESLDETSFAYDFEAKQLVVNFDPRPHLMEATSRATWGVLGNDANYSILGLGFRRYATSETESLTVAAIFLGGALTTIEDCAFIDMSAAAVHIYSPDAGSVVRHNVWVRNGYTALQVNGQESGDLGTITVSDNWFNGNNDLFFGTDCSASCGQANVKMAHLRGYTVTRNVSENPRGNASGLWCDLDCRNGVYTYNIVRGNKDGVDGGVGIYHEVSDTGLIAGNLVENHFYGITVASPNTKVYNNTLVNNVQGIRVYDDPRGHHGDTGPNTTNVQVANNIVLGTWSWNGVIWSASDEVRGDQLVSLFDHNFLWLPQTPQDFIGWYPGIGNDGFQAYANRQAFCHDTGLECHSQWITGAPPLLRNYRPTARARRLVTAATLPQDVADALGVAANTSYLGAYR